jgi:hypothetical protein
VIQKWRENLRVMGSKGARGRGPCWRWHGGIEARPAAVT